MGVTLQVVVVAMQPIVHIGSRAGADRRRSACACASAHMRVGVCVCVYACVLVHMYVCAGDWSLRGVASSMALLPDSGGVRT